MKNTQKKLGLFIGLASVAILTASVVCWNLSSCGANASNRDSKNNKNEKNKYKGTIIINKEDGTIQSGADVLKNWCNEYHKQYIEYSQKHPNEIDWAKTVREEWVTKFAKISQQLDDIGIDIDNMGSIVVCQKEKLKSDVITFDGGTLYLIGFDGEILKKFDLPNFQLTIKVK